MDTMELKGRRRVIFDNGDETVIFIQAIMHDSYGGPQYIMDVSGDIYNWQHVLVIQSDV